MKTTIRERLLELADENYRTFSASLIPNIGNVLGVRLPELRKLAKAIAKGDWRSYLASADNDYFEETMLQGMVIGYAKTGVEERLRLVADFVPKIDNWSICDSFCVGLKFAGANKPRVWEFLQPYLRSDREFEIRFGVVMLLDYFVDERHIGDVLQRLAHIRHEGYYARMAVAWALAECYAKFPELTMSCLEAGELDDFTYNKALQKIVESNRVDAESKRIVRAMKQKAVKARSLRGG
ncbi:DNA alkylation repair protein [Cohnella algarum]|uniref:DNA alkylation repair protein n=1 Tax=Cohnella algarum TaxID=2044859 RepID=UPI001967882D|nr:DNA alkylation repair protein [Cohnella algarum]